MNVNELKKELDSKIEQLKANREALQNLQAQQEQGIVIVRRLEGACSQLDELVQAEAAKAKEKADAKK